MLPKTKLNVPVVQPAGAEVYDAITAQGFVPNITNEQWNVRGWGYNVKPGW